MTTDHIEEDRLPAPPPGQVPAEIEALVSKATELEQQARTLIREQPVVAVLAAVGVGYMVARLFARGTR